MLFAFFKLSIFDFVKFHLWSFLSYRKAIKDDLVHLEAAASWLVRSVGKVNGRGSSKGYGFPQGWKSAYPETSGYIIRTFIDLFHHYNNQKYQEIATSIGEWELSVQFENGGFVGRELGIMIEPIVFNTGQVLLGFNSLYRETLDERYLNASIKAGEFLVSCLDKKGCFVRSLYKGTIHTYNVRVAWALLELGLLSGLKNFSLAGEKNVEWTLKQQQQNGFFRYNSFVENVPATTHTIGYVLRGLLESHLITNNNRYLDSVILAAEEIISKYGIYKKFSSEINEKWRNISKHICLTGYAQLAIVFLKLFRINNDPRYLNIALHFIDDVKIHPNTQNSNQDYFGAVQGSFPIYGRYAPLQFPNWATKFFVDALLLKIEVLKEYEDSIFDQLPIDGQQEVEAGID